MDDKMLVEEPLVYELVVEKLTSDEVGVESKISSSDSLQKYLW